MTKTAPYDIINIECCVQRQAVQSFLGDEVVEMEIMELLTLLIVVIEIIKLNNKRK